MSAPRSLASPLSLAALLVAEALVLVALDLPPIVRAVLALVFLYGGWGAARRARLAWTATTPTPSDLRVFAAAFAALFWVLGNRGAVAAAAASPDLSRAAAWLPLAAAAALVIAYLVGLARQEGLAFFGGAAVVATAAVVVSFLLDPAPSFARLVPQTVAAALLLGSLASPDLARPLHDLWKPVGHGILVAFTRVGLTAVYFLAVLPTGFLLRLAGRDPLDRRLDPAATTYWKQREPTHTGFASRLERYRRQF